jgi:hypothetical protein
MRIVIYPTFIATVWHPALTIITEYLSGQRELFLGTVRCQDQQNSKSYVMNRVHHDAAYPSHLVLR